MGLDAPWHWIILAVAVLVLFGYKRLPEAARSVGRSLRIFKTEMKGMSEDDAARTQQVAPTPPPAPPVTPVTPVTPATTSVSEPNHRTD